MDSRRQLSKTKRPLGFDEAGAAISPIGRNSPRQASQEALRGIPEGRSEVGKAWGGMAAFLLEASMDCLEGGALLRRSDSMAWLASRKEAEESWKA